MDGKNQKLCNFLEGCPYLHFMAVSNLNDMQPILICPLMWNKRASNMNHIQFWDVSDFMLWWKERNLSPSPRSHPEVLIAFTGILMISSLMDCHEKVWLSNLNLWFFPSDPFIERKDKIKQIKQLRVSKYLISCKS